MPLVFAIATAHARPTTLHATLDLHTGLEDGWLNPATETAGLRGRLL